MLYAALVVCVCYICYDTQIRRVDTEILGAVRQQSSSGTRAK